MADISFNIACKVLKIAHIAQLNQLFQRLHLVHMYGHGFYAKSYANEDKCKQWRQQRFAYTLCQSKIPENHTFHSGTYLYGPYMAVPLPSPPPPSTRELAHLGQRGNDIAVG